MTKSLTTLISNVQALLLDNGTRFSDTTVTAAIRAALKDFNLKAPIYAGTLVDVVTDQKEYVLNNADFENLLEISDVLLWDNDGDDHEPLNFDGYFEDAAPVIRLRETQTSGDFLIVRFTLPYTVSGLDSATESTIPVFWDDVLLDGSCYWACVIRSAGRVETINLNKDVSDNMAEVKEFFKAAFEKGLAQAAHRKPPVGEPSQAAWNDQWHGRE